MLVLTALITGIATGSMYGLLALGFHVTWAVSRTVNFAQGSSMMLGAVLLYGLAVTYHVPGPVAVLVALALCGVYGLIVERCVVRPFVVRGSEAWLMATVAVGIVLDNADSPDLAIAASLLDFVGYRGSLDVSADALAHVDRRLVEVARALATRPAVLLLDEPAAGLGAEDTRRVGALLRAIADCGVAVLLVDHDMALVMDVSAHVVVPDAGRVLAAGRPADVQADPAVRAAYLGERSAAGRVRAHMVRLP
jgi:hypothetical protein